MRVRVWENFVERLPGDVGTLGAAALDALAVWKINGREIKNILNMAVSWCRKKKCPLAPDVVEHLIATIYPSARREDPEGAGDGSGAAAASLSLIDYG